tara:strand:- start:20333 stop:21502 length:1170 start_codon:yes stop_codon:yes gene_type:complete
MPFDNFIGAAKRLDDIDINIIGHRIAVGEDEVHAFMDVEAASSGFDDLGRPKMLFEPHVFYRLLGPGIDRDKAVAEGLAYRDWKPGSYPRDSYPRLKKAMEINETAAMQASSWGLGQILGTNFREAGYRSVQDMVRDFMIDEDNHLEAMIRFIINAGIADDLRNHRWATVARVYNGPGYAKHGYHTRLANAYRKWTRIRDTEWSPAREPNIPMNGEDLKAVQRRLRELGYPEVGAADGKWGTRTRAAVLAFRADNNLPIYVGIDEQFKAALLEAKPRDIAPERANATTNDLRAQGSRTVDHADKAEAAGAVGLGGAGLGLALEGIQGASDSLGAVDGLVSRIAPLKETIYAIGPWVGLGLGAFVVYQMYQAKKARVEDHRTGKNAGGVS